MSQKYKFFINGKPLFLAQNPAEVAEILTTPNQFIIQLYKDKKQLRRLLEILLGNINDSSMVIYFKDVQKLRQAVISEFDLVEAAGGVVRNDEGKVLLIRRKGFWDLPKGKIEEGESHEEAAVREVMEETGIRNVELGGRVTYPEYSNECTYHTYRENDRNILKASHWFHMTAAFYGELQPQAEEEIEEAVWADPSDLGKFLTRMYPSIKDVLGASLKIDRIELPD